MGGLREQHLRGGSVKVFWDRLSGDSILCDGNTIISKIALADV
jgi:hypothetical protein